MAGTDTVPDLVKMIWPEYGTGRRSAGVRIHPFHSSGVAV
jgi:hypothetical protein